MPEICDDCGFPIRGPVHEREGRRLCSPCSILAGVDRKAALERCGGKCEQCGDVLEGKTTVFSYKDGVLCFECDRKNAIANWKPLPDAPLACDECGKSFAGSQVAMEWQDKALCGRCLDKVRKDHPYVKQIRLIPLVDLASADGIFACNPGLSLRLLDVDDPVSFDDIRDEPKEYIN